MSRYLIVIENAGSNYSAYSPDLPGCATTGVTVEETKRNMEGAIEIHLDGPSRRRPADSAALNGR